jgi:TRAP-type uncharacterized transport system substrate-binding protein
LYCRVIKVELPEWVEILMSKFSGFVFAACLLPIATSTSVPAAGPDWPKSLTLGTASPGGVYYVYGDELAKILTEKLGITVNPGRPKALSTM